MTELKYAPHDYIHVHTEGRRAARVHIPLASDKD
jgi:hypothetical protein